MKLSFKRFVLFVAIAIFFSKVGWAQTLYPHSLGVGLNAGVSRLGFDESANPVLGVDLNHQRNWARYFSIRTNLGINYFLPDEWKYYSSSGLDVYEEEQIRQGVNISLIVTPVFYFRKGGFAFFLGPGLGLGNYSRFEKITTIQGGAKNVSRDRDDFARLVARSIFGVSFKAFNRKDDVEVIISPHLWLDFEDLDPTKLIDEPTWYSITITYRFNFTKG